MNTSLDLLESLTVVYPELHPDQAGTFDLMSRLTAVAAAARAELHLHPNYRYAKPNISDLNHNLSNALKSLARIKAAFILRTNDFKLPYAEEAEREISKLVTHQIDLAWLVYFSIYSACDKISSSRI